MDKFKLDTIEIYLFEFWFNWKHHRCMIERIKQRDMVMGLFVAFQKRSSEKIGLDQTSGRRHKTNST